MSVMVMTSCGDDAVDCDAASFNSEVNAAINAVNAAGQTWANDPTQENCDALKDASNEYLDAVESYEGCDGFNQSDFQQALQQARQAVNDIPC